MRIVLLGPPGAGKGTQAKVLSQKQKLPHISTGDIFRDTLKGKSKIARTLSAYMKRGSLVPDGLVNQIIARRLKRPDAKKGFILDGYPRTVSQAKALDKFLASSGILLDAVIYMETSRKVILERLTGRRVCEACGFNFHIKNIPPKRAGYCDFCGGRLYQRKDDKRAIVLERLKVYKKETAALIDYYKDKGILKTVSGDLLVDALYKVLHELF